MAASGSPPIATSPASLACAGGIRSTDPARAGKNSAVQAEQPEPLWREVVGDTEPWRRGRIFLVVLAVWVLATQIIGIGSSVLLGQIERVLAAAIGGIVFWLLFYFIWIGVHWVRWICGGSMALLAFAHLIWGIRDGNLIRLISGSLNFPVAAYLALAPSVYFFALRQKERVRWKESLAVAACLCPSLRQRGGDDHRACSGTRRNCRSAARSSPTAHSAGSSSMATVTSFVPMRPSGS
jgi:hypothetical protein